MLADVFSVLSNPALLLWWALACGLGIFLSVTSFRHPSKTCENPRTILGAAAALIPLYGGMLSSYSLAFDPKDVDLPSPWMHGYGNAAPAVILSIPIALCWAAFAVKAGAFLAVDWIPSLWMGDDRLRIERTFDKAEALERKGDVEGALREYIRLIEAEPKSWQARARFAELFLRTGQRRRGEEELRRAVELAKEPHVKAPLVFRLSDLRRDAGDLEAARRILKMFLAQEPPEPYHTHALERLGRL